MATLYERFLSDPRAIRIVLAEMTVMRPDGTTFVYGFGDDGWNTDADEARPHVHFHRALIQGLNIEGSLLQPSGVFGGCSEPTFGAVVADNRNGQWDAWADYSLDQLSMKILMVGYLGDGTIVRYTDALTSPVLIGVGVDRPAVGDTMKLFIRSRLGALEKEAQPELYAPPCPIFPGAAGAYIDFGDYGDLPAGSWTVEGFFYTEDPRVSGQTLIAKDAGASPGWLVDVGTSGDGVIRALAREQVNPTSVSAASAVKIRRWTHFAMVFDSAASQRRLVLDGTTVTTTAAVTGNITNTATALRIGAGLLGRVSWVRAFSVARSDATIRAEMYLPRTGTEASLLWDLRLDEGKLLTSRDQKVGASGVGNLIGAITWGVSGWIGAQLAGKKRRQVIGRVRDVELMPRDPTKLVFEAGIGPLYELVPYSMANAIAGASFTNDLTRGITTFVPGTVFGKITADVTGALPRGYAGYFDGVDDWASATTTCPAGAMTLVAFAETRTSAATGRMIAGWRNGTAAGRRTLGFGSTGTNLMAWQVINDAATSFLLTSTGIPEAEFFVVVATLDPAAGKMGLWINGSLMGELAISGTWNTVLSAFGAGRLPDTALNFLDGRIDSMGVFARVLTTAEIQKITIRGILATDTPLDAWLFAEGTGTSVANLMPARPALTLNSGATWSWSRSTVLDCAIYLLGRAGISPDFLDPAPACAMLRDLPGDAGWVLEDDQNLLSHLSDLLAGHGAALVENGSTYMMDIVRLPSGVGAVPVTERHVTQDPIDPLIDQKAIWNVTVWHNRTFSVYNTEDIATIAASNPDRYRTATQEYQSAPWTDSSILTRFPGSGGLEVRSALYKLRDAERLAVLLLSIYRPNQRGFTLQLDTDAVGLRLMGEMSLLLTEAAGTVRFGGLRYYRIVSFAKQDTRYQLVIWMKA